MLVATCNTIANKLPAVTATAPRHVTMETGLSDAAKADYEHLVGLALRDTAAVQWVTREFATRLARLIVGAGAFNNKTRDQALLTAVTPPPSMPWVSPPDRHNTGFVGANATRVAAVLGLGPDGLVGNIREVWGLVYVISKMSGVTEILAPMAAANATDKLAQLGCDVEKVMARQREIDITNELPARPSPLQASNGILDYKFPDYGSWSRFNFPAVDLNVTGNGTAVAGATQWTATRLFKGCVEVNLTTASVLHPPLSPAELAYQCNGSTARPCKLHWYPGRDCYTINHTATFAPRIPGYHARASALGYRMVAGPSGTTSDVMQYAELLGFGAQDQVLLRAAMAAWMLVTDDHSFYEIMLAADEHMPPKFKMVQGLHDLKQLFPAPVTTSTGEVFADSAVWHSLGTQFRTSAGRALYQKLGDDQKEYLDGLLSTADGSDTAGADLLAVWVAIGIVAVMAGVGVVRYCRRRDRNAGPTYAQLPGMDVEYDADSN